MTLFKDDVYEALTSYELYPSNLYPISKSNIPFLFIVLEHILKNNPSYFRIMENRYTRAFISPTTVEIDQIHWIISLINQMFVLLNRFQEIEKDECVDKECVDKESVCADIMKFLFRIFLQRQSKKKVELNDNHLILYYDKIVNNCTNIYRISRQNN